MPLIIDGYNLLYAGGFVGHVRGPRGLESSRVALLNFLVESLPAAEIKRTTVVFDAAGAPRDLPQVLSYRGLKIRFARDYDTADALIAELIRAESAPKRLTVVSSDHQVQKAAGRRKATAIDSERWYEEIVAKRTRRRKASSAEVDGKPGGGPSAGELEYWLAKFEGAGSKEEPAGENIFPPGYGEDVEEMQKDE